MELVLAQLDRLSLQPSHVIIPRPSPRALLRRYPTPSCDACPAPAKVVRYRAPPGYGPAGCHGASCGGGLPSLFGVTAKMRRYGFPQRRAMAGVRVKGKTCGEEQLDDAERKAV